MTTPLPHRRFPTAYVTDQQIAYVTDNDRDAEALSCEMQSPVVSDRRNPSIRHLDSTIIIRQTSQTFETSRRTNARNVSDVRDVSDVSEIVPATNAPDVSDVPDSSGVQTSRL